MCALKKIKMDKEKGRFPADLHPGDQHPAQLPPPQHRGGSCPYTHGQCLSRSQLSEGVDGHRLSMPWSPCSMAWPSCMFISSRICSAPVITGLSISEERASCGHHQLIGINASNIIDLSQQMRQDRDNRLQHVDL